MQEKNNRSKLLTTLGLCRRAGRLVCGTPLVCEALRRRDGERVLAIIASLGASEATRKKIGFKCEFYGVPLYLTDASPVELASAIGKGGAVACVGVRDENFVKALQAAGAVFATPKITTGKEASVQAEDGNI